MRRVVAPRAHPSIGSACPRRGTVLLAATVLTVACAGAPAPISDAEQAAAGSVERVRVRLLGDGFVERDGERVPIERFVLELRQDARRRLAARRELPAIDVEVSGSSPLDTTRDLAFLQDEARKLGVPEIAMSLVD
jgi:hypothetical protein